MNKKTKQISLIILSLTGISYCMEPKRFSPLVECVQGGYIDLVKNLLEVDSANINKRGDRGNTALIAAVNNIMKHKLNGSDLGQAYTIFHILLSYKPSLSCKNDDGESAYSLAKKNNLSNVVDILDEYSSLQRLNDNRIEEHSIDAASSTNNVYEENRQNRASKPIKKIIKKPKPNDNKFKCEIEGCNYFCSSSNTLYYHKQAKHMDGPFTCNSEGCSYSCENKNTLKQHKYRNHSNQTLNCDLEGCNFTSNTKENLTNHKRNNHSNQTFVCDVEGCNYMSNNYSTFNSHKYTKHNNQIFTCDVEGCGYFCNNYNTFYSHTHSKHTNRILTCNINGCDYSCDTYYALHQHKKLTHNN